MTTPKYKVIWTQDGSTIFAPFNDYDAAREKLVEMRADSDASNVYLEDVAAIAYQQREMAALRAKRGF